MRTCQQCDKIYLRSAAGQVKAHFVGISGIRTLCRPSNWIYAGAGNIFWFGIRLPQHKSQVQPGDQCRKKNQEKIEIEIEM